MNGIGVYELQWDPSAPVGTVNSGNFVLSGEWLETHRTVETWPTSAVCFGPPSKLTVFGSAVRPALLGRSLYRTVVEAVGMWEGRCLCGLSKDGGKGGKPVFGLSRLSRKNAILRCTVIDANRTSERDPDQ